MTNHNLLEALLTSAAHIGANVKVEMDKAREALAKARDKRSEIDNEIAQADKDSAGLDSKSAAFDSPRFVGLAKIGADFTRLYNGRDSQDSRDAAVAAAQVFVTSFTGQTDKSAKGGKGAGYAATIMLGSHAERLRFAMQQRLDHWRQQHDSTIEGESGGDAAARKAEARRYLTPCGDALMEDGSLPVDSKGVTKVPKFNGRPARVVNGISIPFGRGTNRDSQMAEASRLYAMHGDAVMMPEVLDALLDNGGRYKPEEDQSLSRLCADARTSLDKIMAAGGSASGDAAFLTALHSVLGRIMAEGFKDSVVAEAPAGTSVPDEAPRSPNVVKAGEEDSAFSPESDDLLGDLGGEPLDAAQTPKEAAQDVAAEPGEGVTLGAPVAATKRQRGPRKNKGGEVQAGA